MMKGVRESAIALLFVLFFFEAGCRCGQQKCNPGSCSLLFQAIFMVQPTENSR